MQINSSVAHHEAAHAIVAAQVGYDVLEIRCLRDEAYVQAGEFRCTGTTPIQQLRTRLSANMMFALGGAVGESEFTHEPTRMILARCRDDRANARRAAVAFALTLPEWHSAAHLEVLEVFLRRTRQIVRANWHVITTLAEKLALNGHLDGRDVLRAIEIAERKAA